MAKTGLNLKTARGCLRSKQGRTGWAMCVGAGISLPIFPSWHELVHRLIQRFDDGPEVDEMLGRLSKSFSYDTLIQAVCHRTELTHDEFASLLSGALYFNLKSNATAHEWKIIATALTSVSLTSLTERQWGRLLNFFFEKYQSSSALAVAEILANSIQRKVPPTAILTFNAEASLYALTNAFLVVNRKHTKRQSVFDLATRAIANTTSVRIPFYFCHGLLPVPGSATHKLSPATVDKLVFSEAEYLTLANSSFSWQSTAFLNTAMTRSIVFIGLSFNDPNLRRWLSWVHLNRQNELSGIGVKTQDISVHYWLRVRPESETEEKWIESSVAHLGVRLVWLDDWTDIRQTLSAMLCL